MRLFLAINLPDDLRAEVWAAAQPLRAALPDSIAWVREASLHVTLRFLGEQPAGLVGRLTDALDLPLARLERPRVELTAVGAFPTMRRPRVLWIGGQTNSALAELYQQVERACGKMGFGPERREFRPHVTVGRVRPRAAVDIEELARATATVEFRGALVVRTIEVMESQLTSAGARYRVAAAIPVGSRG